jgi:thiol-disulfide isomerase/thioredoxin
MRPLPYILTILGLLALGGLYVQLKSNNNLSMNIFDKSNTPGINEDNNPDAIIDFKDYGRAPEFTGIEKWLNSDPVLMAELKGKVVLVDFWTYSCINCIRTLPYITKWHDTYKDQGLVVVGVHTPEFAFEKVTSNVENAIKRFKINYPVAQDNNYRTWSAYSNQFWPAEYLIDREGKIVYTHFGEGKYEVTENAIRQLLGLPGGITAEPAEPIAQNRAKTQEIYFGLDRLQSLANKGQATKTEQAYSLPENLPQNTFALEGIWKLDADKAVLTQGHGRIRLNFNAGKVHMVASSIKPVTVKVFIDGKAQPDLAIQESQLYTLFDSEEYKGHILEIEIPQAGFEAFTFTFG